MRAIGRILAALLLVAAAGAAAQSGRVQMLDYGEYSAERLRSEPDPGQIAGQRAIIDNLQHRRAAEVILGRPGVVFGLRYRVLDPALNGRSVTHRLIHPRQTNPATGQSATRQDFPYRIDAAAPEHWHFFMFEFDWELADGEWTFQVIADGQVILERKFKVEVAMN